MPVPLVLMAAGTALQIYGNLKANYDQSQAELANAKFYEDQAEFAREAQFRAEAITSRQYEARKGAQISAYAKGNVDISGSAALVIAETLAEKAEELTAIQKKGDIEFRLAMARSRMATSNAQQLVDPVNNILQAGSTLLTSAAKYKEAGGVFSFEKESSGGSNPTGHSGPYQNNSMFKTHTTGEWDYMMKRRNTG